MGQKKQLSISVLVVSRNRWRDLSQCLNSIANQKRRPNEIVIVENNDKKTLLKIIKQLDTKIPIKYYLEKRINIAHARNTAVKNASCDLVAFTDDDCVASESWVNKIYEIFTKSPNIAGMVGRSLNYYGKNKIAQLEQILNEAWLSQYLKLNKSTKLTSGAFINTRNFAVRRSVFEKYQVKFNPFAPYKIEDTDFGLRLFKKLNSATEQIFYIHEVVVYHKDSTNLLDFMRRRNLSRKGRSWLIRTHPKFEQQMFIRDSSVFSTLQKKNPAVWTLFFLERQRIRLERLFGKVT